MTQLPTNRSTSSTIAEHTSDHNILNAQHNELDGHAADTAAHDIEDTINAAISALVDTAPATLNTLNELAAALGDDANFATTITNALAGKSSTSHHHDAAYEAAGAVVAHTGDTSDAHDASAVSFAPAGGIAATDVQAAIVELDTEKSGTGHAHSGTYVPLAEIDAKGDLLVGSANDTLNNLPVGTNGHVLTADSAETLGVKWAAAAGGGADGQSSLFASGRYVTRPHTTRSTLAVTSNLLYATPIWVPETLTVDRIACEVTTGGGAGSVARLGIYSDANGLPGTLLLETATIGTTTTGVKEATISQQLTVGPWWLVVVNQAGTPATYRANGSAVSVYSISEATPSNSPVVGFSQSSVTGALPGTFSGTTELGAAPYVWLRAA